MSFGALIDFRGFYDLRYTVLCIGTFFAILGLWIPSYYISTYQRPQSKPVSDFSAETYASVTYDGNKISEYFLCIMNGCSILGAIV
jgi:MCP family monocarboxylic acid transporter-like MFS transporter 10